MEGFHVEGLSPNQMVKVHLLLEAMEIRIVKDQEMGYLSDFCSDVLAVKVYSRRKKKPSSGPSGALGQFMFFGRALYG